MQTTGPEKNPTALWAVGIVLVLTLVATTSTARAAWTEIARFLSLTGKPEPASANVLSEHHLEGLDSMPPQAQAEFLLKEHCQEAQGFLYGRPLPACEFEALLRSRRVAGLERRNGKRARHMPRFQQRVGKNGRRHYS